MKPKGYSYVRFSTGDQIKGDSLRRQTEATENWCRKNGVQLVQRYKDLGVSAFHGKNAEIGDLAKFLELVRSGKIEKGSYLIVESLDRVSRSKILDALQLFTNIINSGIKLVTLSDGQIYDSDSINANWTGLIISLTVMSRAHEESRTKSQRIAAAWVTKRKNVADRKLTSRCVAWLQLSGDRKRFEVIPAKARIVRRIFELASTGVSSKEIARTFRREGVEPIGRQGKVWFPSYIKKILDSRAVIGEFTPAVMRNGKREFLEPIPDYYPAVVDKKLFATVAQIRRAHPRQPRAGLFNVFSMLAYDRDTGSTMVYVNKNRARGWHYLLPGAVETRGVKSRLWQYDDFLSSFLTVCEKAALQRPPKAKERGNGKLALLRMELSDVEKQIARLVDVLSRGASASIELKLRTLEKEKARLTTAATELEDTAVADHIAPSQVDWKDTASLRENLTATVKRITVDPVLRSFSAEFFDGRTYIYERTGDTVAITSGKGLSLEANRN